MFKAGDKVRIKPNIKEIIEERERNHERYVEAQWMIKEYRCHVFTIKQVAGDDYLLDNDLYWGEYALEYADVHSLNNYSLLL